MPRSYLQARLEDLEEKVSGEDADKLAEALGMLPLALAHAAAFILNRATTVGEYLSQLDSLLLRKVMPGKDSLPDEYREVITATWEISIRQANETEPAGLARPLLQLASVLDSAGIPQRASSGV